MSRVVLQLFVCVAFTAMRADGGEAPGRGAHDPSTGSGAIECRVEPKAFNPTAGGKAVFRFKLPDVNQAKVWLVDPLGRIVATVKATGPDAKGVFEGTWNGRGEDGAVAPDDAYCYLPVPSEARPPEGGLPKLPLEGGARLKCRETAYDPKTGKISYLLPEAGRVRIRVGVKEGPVLRTLLDWAAQPAGRHAIVWDGKDSSGLAWSSERCTPHIWAYSLPGNCVITHGGPLPEYPAYVEYFVEPSVEDPEYHAKHARQVCHEPRFSVTFPGISTKDGGLKAANGRLPVRVELDPRDRRALIASLFEVVFYVDGVFFFEDSNATDPLTCTLDLRKLGEGTHVLTVQIMDYEGHIASHSFEIII